MELGRAHGRPRFQVDNDGHLYWSGDPTDGETWLDSGHILKAESRGLTDGLDVKNEKKREDK